MIEILKNSMKEICICAAIKTPSGFIFRGHRHSDCYRTAIGVPTITKFDTTHSDEGFITSKNRFVGREEAYELQIAAGIKSANRTGYDGKRLFSEDLY